MEELMLRKDVVGTVNQNTVDQSYAVYIEVIPNDIETPTVSPLLTTGFVSDTQQNEATSTVTTDNLEFASQNPLSNKIKCYVKFRDHDEQFNLLEEIELKNFTGSIQLSRVNAPEIKQPKINFTESEESQSCYDQSKSTSFSDIHPNEVHTRNVNVNAVNPEIYMPCNQKQAESFSKFRHLPTKQMRLNYAESDKMSFFHVSQKVDRPIGMPLFVRQIRHDRRHRMRDSDDTSSPSSDVLFGCDDSSLTNSTTSHSTFPTKLHMLCSQNTLSSSELDSVLNVHGLLSKEGIREASRIPDKYDNLPLHLIGSNDFLMYSSPEIARRISYNLMKAYPDSITTLDTQHRMPFVSMIEDWYYYHISAKSKDPALNDKNRYTSKLLEYVTKPRKPHSTQQRTESKRKSSSLFQKNHDHELNNSFSNEETAYSDNETLVNSTVKTVTRADKTYVKFPSTSSLSNAAHQNLSGTIDIDCKKVQSDCRVSRTYAKLTNTMSQDDSICRGNMTSDEEKAALMNVASVSLWVEIDNCFQILSTALELLLQDEQNRTRTGRIQLSTNEDEKLSDEKREDDDPVRTLLRHILQTLPNIVYIILLIDNDDDRHRILQYPITRRLLLCPESVGPWFTMLLRRQSKCKLAVDYLVEISNLSSSAYINSREQISATNPDDKYNDFYRAQRSVFLAVKKTSKTIASLSLLESKEIERVTSTNAVQYIVSKSLSRSFLVGMVLMEFTLHITLMEAFRSTVFVTAEYNEFRPMLGTVPLNVVVLICCNDLIRKGCEAVSLLFLSTGSLRAYFSNIRTVFDVVTTLLVLFTVISKKMHPDNSLGALSACVIAMLWIRVLSYLKVINEQMALFVAALGQILVDARFLGVVLLVLIFMFGDMMQILVTSKDDGEFCESVAISSDPPAAIVDFCSGSRSAALLRVYSVLFGAFDLEDYKETMGLTVLFVAYTLIGIVILLTVLIAVISDSYERSRMTSENLFRAARLQFVAQYEALEEFLEPGADIFDHGRNYRKAFRAVFRWFVLLSLVSTAFVAEMFLVSSISNIIESESLSVSYLVCVILLSLILGIALWIVTRFAIVGIIRQCAPRSIYRGLDASEHYTNIVVKQLSSLLFGGRNMNAPGRQAVPDAVDVEVVQSDTTTTKQVEEIFEATLLKVKDELKQEILNLEWRLNEKKHQQSF